LRKLPLFRDIDVCVIVLLTNPLCVVVEEDKEPEKCVICGEQIKLKEGEKICKKCGTEYDVKLKFLF
jgi:predicted amidophosphoribosyltransferase